MTRPATDAPTTALRLAMLANGYSPIPVAGKAPVFNNWPNVAIDEAAVRSWASTCASAKNTGARTRTTPTIDIDVRDAAAADAIEALVRERFGNGAGRLMRRVGEAPKRAFLFRTDAPFAKMKEEFVAPGAAPGEKPHKIEILASGQQVVVDGVHPDTRGPYSWFGGEPWTVPRGDLPELTEAAARAFLDECVKLLLARGWRKVEPEAAKATAGDVGGEDHLPLIVRLATAMWGSEHRGMTAPGEWRFGARGSKSVDSMTRQWFDFEANVGGGIRDLMKMVSDARGGAGKAPAGISITATAHNFPEASTIAPWDWLYGRHILRGTVSGTAAMGGTGKSALAIVEALALTSGKSLLNVEVRRPIRVLLINLEDNRNAMDKRIAAAMRHHGLTPADVGGRLVVVAKGEMKLKIAKCARGGGVERNEDMIKALIQYVVEKKIDVVSVDPFVKTHGINENDNSEVSDVVECYDDVAEGAGCGVHLWHHTRKMRGDGATVESARGAIAFIDGCRSVRILETMTKEEGQKLRVEHASYYFRSFNGKRNFAPPSDASDWYRLVAVEVGNGFDVGDEVGVPTRWDHPGAREIDVNAEMIAAIKRVVREGNWREDVRASAWVGKPIARALGLDPDDDGAAIRRLLKKLIADGVLKVVQAKDQRRHDAMFVVVNEPVRGS
jgi:AAA domain/Bifunctional DNA primase/polymerase, N-terminal